jgi:hypothetical protein
MRKESNQMSEQIEWPETPDVSENDPQANVKLELYKAQLDMIRANHQAGIDLEKERLKTEVDLQTADYANEYATFQEVYKGYIEVAKGGIDRSLQRADFVQKVAAAIGTVYVGIVALSFSIEKDAALPVTGMIPTIFLGLSFFLAAIFVSYITQPGTMEEEPSNGTLRGSQISRRNNFILWTRRTTMRRGYFLQASVISLGISIFFLPVPYLSTDIDIWWLVGIGILLTFLIPIVVHISQKDLQEKKT